MHKIVNKILLANISSLLIISYLFAQPDQVFIGTRPQGMGEAFLAVADDGNAIFWNPAGLARMERIQASFSYADLFGSGINSYYTSFLSRLYFIPCLTDYLTYGVDWFSINLADDEELDFNQNQFNFALGFKPPPGIPYLRDFSFGLSAKYFSMAGEAYGISETEVDVKGWGWNFGLLYHFDNLKFFPGLLNMGFMIHDIGGTRIKHLNTDKQEKILDQNIRCGLSYRPFEEFPVGKISISDPVFAIDIDDRFHFGIEFWVGHTFAFRAGIQKDLHTNEKMTFSLGLGIKTNLKDLPGLNVDYALTDSPMLPNTNKQFGGSLVIRDNPRLIRIEGVTCNNIFASLYPHYGLPGSSIGTIQLVNVHEEDLKVFISFEEDKFIASQQADTLTLEPKTPVTFPLRASFKPDLFYVRRGKISANVKIAYHYKDVEFSTTAPLNFNLYEKNYLTWDPPAKAVAFVTYDDEIVNKFKSAALNRTIKDEQPHWFLNYHTDDALKIFHALEAYGVAYTPDPTFPLLTDFQLDKITYPAELLTKEKIQDRKGDCDDLSVLFASLLQNAGIPSALISEPGHLYMMFDTGIPVVRKRTLPFPPGYFIPWKGTLWIPMDMAEIHQTGFIGTWEKAAKERYSKDDEIFEVAVNQNLYPPPKLKPDSKWILYLPDFSTALHKDLDKLQVMTKEYFQRFENILSTERLSRSERIDSMNFYGVVLGQNDDYLLAKKQFKRALNDSSSYAPAMNNLANVEFILGNFEQADSLYTKALNHSFIHHHGTYLNLAILYQMMKDGAAPADTLCYQEKSIAALTEAARLFHGDAKEAFAYLQYPEEDSIGKTKGFAKKNKNKTNKIKKAKNFIDRSFKKIAKKQKVKVALDRHGSKGRSETDDERWALLWWNF